ncbi:MAG: hypothetical protein IPK97_11005 [Ahniella sp.]|nr:hypothetical protein [Ahniella sp.]
MFPNRWFFCCLISWLPCLANAGVEPNTVLLDARFNDQPLNAQIGTGGASLGQPVSISAGLQAFVVPSGVLPTASLRVRPLASGAARFVSFEFVDSAEVTDGLLTINFLLKAGQLDRRLVYVREQGSAGRDFLSMTLLSSGSIAVSDQSGNSASIGTYTAGALMAFEFRFKMDTGRYSIFLNGVPLATDRAHGITDRGIGSLIIGTDPASTEGLDWFVDDVQAFRLDELLVDGFE